MPVACKTAFYFLRNVSHGADLLQYNLVGLCSRGQTPSIMAICCPLTTPAVCLGANLFPAGLRSAKGVMCSPASCLACSWPVVTWETVGGGVRGASPHTAQIDSPTAPFPPSPLPSSLRPQCPPTDGTCLVYSYHLPMFNSWMGVGTSFPRKKRIPLGSCPVPARTQGTWLRPQPPAWAWGREWKPLMKDTVRARTPPSLVNPQPWNVCGPISKVCKGSRGL